MLGSNKKVYMVPYKADNIGELQLGNTERAYEVVKGVPEAWSALLSPHFSKFSGPSLFFSFFLGP